MIETRTSTCPIVALLVLILSQAILKNVQADDGETVEAFPDKVSLSVGYLRLSDMVTEVSVNSDIGGVGTRLGYARDLGGDDSADVALLRGYYRFNDRHRLDFGAANIGRTGDAVIGIEIDFGDRVFQRGTRVISSIDTSIYKLAYTYSFYHTPKVELSVTGGLNVMQYELKLESENDGREKADVTAPLPVLGLRTGYSITPRWETYFSFETFRIAIDDALTGSLVAIGFGTEYRLFRNIGVGIGLSSVSLDGDAETDSYRGRITDIYHGTEVFLSAKF